MVGAPKNMFVVFRWVLAEGAPIRVARAVLIDEFPGGKHLVAELHEMGAARRVGGSKAVGIPVDGVSNAR